jgi:microcystin degradation protein MlrC
MDRTIALGSIFIESNHFGGIAADMSTFERNDLCRGEEVLQLSTGTVGGMLQVLDGKAHIAPTIVASACPSGPLTSACYRTLKDELLRRLKAQLPVDGVLMPLHGAAAADGAGDLEGDLLGAVRKLVGHSVPIVATLDLHAHVTKRMVQNADALLAWETYPHRDTYSTGQRGARALLDILDGELVPSMVMAKVPVVASGVYGHTEGDGPFADVMRAAKSLERRPEIYSTSAILVHPYLDLPNMGGGALVIANNQRTLAEQLATELAQMYWARRFDLEPKVYEPADTIRRGLAIDGGPILLVETSDCCGGGASGDAVAALKALMDAQVSLPALVPVVDPQAAEACRQAGRGHQVTLRVGHGVDPQWGTPVSLTGTVRRLGNGLFRYRGGIWEGRLGNMGPSAVLEVGSLRILITTHGTYEWADEQFRAMGLEAGDAKFVVAKNPMNYRMSYAGISKAAFILDTPGPTPPTLRHVCFRNLKRPFYPADQDIPGLLPAILHHDH